jgi:mRNA deadenylase 3'-5' endonuclease subunit Ccr4
MLNFNRFKLLQWNTLGKNFCDAKAFPLVDESYRNWDYRKELLKSHISNKNADLMCFEEIDSFEEFKNEIVSESTYDSIYYSKDEGGQGIAFFYNKNKFKLTKSEKVTLPKNDQGEPSNQFFSYYEIKAIDIDKDLVVIATHLKAKAEFEHIRQIQINFLLNYVESKFKDLPIIICGDFNTEPYSGTIQTVMNTNLFKSVYNFDEIEMTTFKIRDKEYYRIIDYIFHNEFVKAIDKSELPTKKSLSDVLTTGLPSKDFPSDHYYLSFNFEL